MNNLAKLLEQELEEAVEVKNKNSLHRYIILLTESMIPRTSYEETKLSVENEIKILAETMKQGFEAMEKRFEAIDRRFEAVDKRFEDMYHYMDKRFEAVDKRFEDMNRRFNMMFTFMTAGLSILIIITTVFKFIGP